MPVQGSCERCGAPRRTSSRFCTTCGLDLDPAAQLLSVDEPYAAHQRELSWREAGEPRTPTESAGTKPCPDCAEAVQDAAKVCRFCGFRFDIEVPGAQAAAVLTASGAARERKERAADAPKSKVGAAVLSLLLAPLGLFYVGETSRGAVYLACAVAGALAVVAGGSGLVVLVVGVVAAFDAYQGAAIYNDSGTTRGVGAGLWALLGVAVTLAAVDAAVAGSDTTSSPDADYEYVPCSEFPEAAGC